MSGHLTLILGGARSGKSRWAEHLARQGGRPVLYIATATAGDDEMAERIARHRTQRPPQWRTVEEPERLPRAIEENAAPGEDVIVDCLTLWVSNVILREIGAGQDADSVLPTVWASIEDSLVSAAQTLHTLAHERDLTLILVSNEVGMGIVPASALGRRFGDILGRINQTVAGAADSTVLMIAGLPIDLRTLIAASRHRDNGGMPGA